MRNRFAIYCMGCKVNISECASLKAALIEEGFVYVDVNDNPDIIIVNTCAVTHVADKKSRQHIRSLMNKCPDATVCVMGCYSQRNHDFVFNELHADIVVGCSDRKKIVEYLKSEAKGDFTEVDTSKFNFEEISNSSDYDVVRAFLKIQDGCDNFCSYCIIPYVRGRCRSRNKDEIITEAKNLVAKGHKEIILTGIHVGAYGKDLKDTKFSDLVEEISNIEGLMRLTISSIEASEIDDKLIDLVASRDNIAKHLHIPLQSGCDKILKKMNRKYTVKEFVSKIKKIRDKNPDIFIGSDVIVGFPGETEADFFETHDLIKTIGFNRLHVFPFSPRKGTPAYDMRDQVNPILKQYRVERLIKLSNSLYDQFLLKNKGKELHALVEEYDEKTQLCKGHTENFIEVFFKGTKEDINTIVEIEYKMEASPTIIEYF